VLLYVQAVEGITNATAVQLDVKDSKKLSFYVSQVDIFTSRTYKDK
jgi:hypothetical protein